MQSDLEDLILIAKELTSKPVYSEALTDEVLATVGDSMDEDIETFLLRCRQYDTNLRRWVNVPTAPRGDTELQLSVMDIFKAVLKHFKRDVRQLVPVYRYDADPSARIYHKKPDILSVIETGDSSPVSASKPFKTAETYWPRCSSPVMLKAERNADKTEDLLQLAIFAIQCFETQCNRAVVYCLKITEEGLMLAMFDRCGVMYTPSFNIHENPRKFVRLILAITSPNLVSVGFDDSIFWNGNDRCINAVGSTGILTQYRVVNQETVPLQDNTHGIGAVRWRVRHSATGRHLLIKDVWAPTSGFSEVQLLEAIKGIPNLEQMVEYVEIGMRIPEGKEESSNGQVMRLSGKVLTRLVLECSGRPITEFRSRLEILYALRDGILGHQTLWNKGIIHGNISVANVRIGNSDSYPGFRGILIDLGLAYWVDRIGRPQRRGRLAGTLSFLSINDLDGLVPGRPSLPYDYLDDLESFFYVFCWIILRHSGPGILADRWPPFLNDWNNTRDFAAENAKKALFSDPLAHSFISPFFGEPFRLLFQRLVNFFSTIIDNRRQIALGSPETVSKKVSGGPAQHYDTILDYFNNAIAEIEGTAQKSCGGEVTLASIENDSVQATDVPYKFVANSASIHQNKRLPGKRKRLSTDSDSAEGGTKSKTKKPRVKTS